MSAVKRPPVPYRTMIRHTRTQAVRHDFRYRHVMWLVDLAAVPDPPRPFRRWLPQFAARDHLGDPGASIRENVDRFLADHGIDLSGGRVLMLTNPRTMGYVFNPITVYWCYEPDDSVRAVIAEVHNTFGDRHCYLVEPVQPVHVVADVHLGRVGRAAIEQVVPRRARPRAPR